jgi:hypothetical protein
LSRKIQQPGTGSEFDASRAQTSDPSAQKARRFLPAGKYPATGADIGFDAEVSRPRAQFRRTEIAQQIAPPFWFIDVTRREILYRLTVGKV